MTNAIDELLQLATFVAQSIGVMVVLLLHFGWYNAILPLLDQCVSTLKEDFQIDVKAICTILSKFLETLANLVLHVTEAFWKFMKVTASFWSTVVVPFGRITATLLTKLAQGMTHFWVMAWRGVRAGSVVTFQNVDILLQRGFLAAMTQQVTPRRIISWLLRMEHFLMSNQVVRLSSFALLALATCSFVYWLIKQKDEKNTSRRLSWPKPPTWRKTASTQQRACRFVLEETSSEYNMVARVFRTSLSSDSKVVIESIKRIQNNELWQCYCSKKHAIKSRECNWSWHHINWQMNKLHEDHVNHECAWLFHGTSEAGADKIAVQGFNRAYSERGLLGRAGVYFAAHSGTSCRYAQHNSSGLKYMFLARVTLGEWCLGKMNQVGPDAKSNDGLELFDSTVNNVDFPSVFAVFHDSQAYPEYLICFKES